MNEKQEAVYEFEEKMNELQGVLGEAFELVRDNFPDISSRAEVYWYRQILGTINSQEHGILGGSMHEMVNTLNEMKEEVDD